jgi:hypothetical protein
MFDRITSYFRPEDTAKKASVALARLLSQYDMESIAYRSELTASRRRSESRQIALGCWIVPFEPNRPDVLDFSAAISSVTYDMRRGGVGVLTQEQVELERFGLALPDKEGVWRFFEGVMRHASRIPGGWNLSGLQLVRILELDPRDLTQFRESVQDHSRDAASVPVDPSEAIWR